MHVSQERKVYEGGKFWGRMTLDVGSLISILRIKAFAVNKAG
jgi:hypothetical protein